MSTGTKTKEPDGPTSTELPTELPEGAAEEARRAEAADETIGELIYPHVDDAGETHPIRLTFERDSAEWPMSLLKSLHTGEIYGIILGLFGEEQTAMLLELRPELKKTHLRQIYVLWGIAIGTPAGKSKASPG